MIDEEKDSGPPRAFSLPQDPEKNAYAVNLRRLREPIFNII
jgi:hypothetical protein